MTRFSRRSRSDDSGFTLVELLVSMTLLTVVLAIFTASFLEVQKGVRKTSSLAAAQGQARQAFTTLDRLVRYANAVNDPVTVASGAQYVEFQIGGPLTASQTCYQWRVTGQLLQSRSFTVTSATAVAGSQTPSNPLWTSVAGGVDTSKGPVFATDPTSSAFSQLEPAGATPVQRQLAFTLRLTSGTNPGGSASVQALFTAANTTSSKMPIDPSSHAVLPPVCQQAGRP